MLRILAYHRVAELRDTPAVDSRSVSATPEVFAQQMEHLARFYRVVSMPDVLEAVETGRTLPKRAVLITFDDAYADFAEIAWPTLKELNLPATMFVPTAYPDYPERAFWSDALYQAFASTTKTELEVSPFGHLPLFPLDQKRRSLRVIQDYLTIIPHGEAQWVVDSVCAELGLGRIQRGSVLSWDQLRELLREGLTLGSHTRTHAIMTRVRPDQMREEIQGSQEDLRRETGACLPIFCYPNGNHNVTVVSALRGQGIRLAFTTLSGPNKLGSVDPLCLHRTVITPRTTPTIFCLRLLRWGIHLDAWRDRKQKAILTCGSPKYDAHLV
ncbi:MAG TPA: polysaccharide deacetylase family protein [Candidatus Acidoferrum sp.]|nr:polysaccharide deacetylase family protein [Candidatus Acidoferrum sp.]